MSTAFETFSSPSGCGICTSPAVACVTPTPTPGPTPKDNPPTSKSQCANFLVKFLHDTSRKLHFLKLSTHLDQQKGILQRFFLCPQCCTLYNELEEVYNRINKAHADLKNLLNLFQSNVDQPSEQIVQTQFNSSTAEVTIIIVKPVEIQPNEDLPEKQSISTKEENLLNPKQPQLLEESISIGTELPEISAPSMINNSYELVQTCDKNTDVQVQLESAQNSPQQISEEESFHEEDNAKISKPNESESKTETQKGTKNSKIHKTKVIIARKIRQFICRYCDKSIWGISAFRSHQYSSHPDEFTHPCNHCPLLFPSLSVLTAHLITHVTVETVDTTTTTKIIFDCLICKKNFHSPVTLENHLTMFHIGNNATLALRKKAKCGKPKATPKLKPCPICGISIINANNSNLMIRHIEEEHEDAEKTYLCNKPSCDKMFCSEIQLKRHKRFPCDDETSYKTLLYKNPIRLSLRTTWFCRYCVTRSMILPRMKWHMVEKHPEKLTHPCHLCEERYTSKVQLESHQLIHLSPEGPFKCLACEEEQEQTEEGNKIWETREKFETHLISSHLVTLSLHSKPQLREFREARRQQKRQREQSDKGNEETVLNLKFPCNICGKMFPSAKDVNSHIHKSHSKKRHSCELCPEKKFSTSNVLIAHLLKIHENSLVQEKESELTCPKCSKPFVTQYMFKRHVNFHNLDDKPHLSCHLCDTRFPLLKGKQFQNHLRHVHKIEPLPKTIHKCPVSPVCEKMFENTGKVREHVTLQHPELFLQNNCDTCKVSYFDPSHLETHLKTHSTQGPYPCMVPTCKEFPSSKIRAVVFISKELLAEHLKTHSGEVTRKKKCTKCSDAFTKQRFLDKHMVEGHGESAKYNCTMCTKRFITRIRLQMHMKRHLDKEKPQEINYSIGCDQCGKKYSTRKNLHNHITAVHKGCRIHKCDHCDKTLTSMKSKLNHMKIHTGVKDHSCYFCGKKFRLKGSLFSHLCHHHTGEKPYWCYICDRRYTISSSVKKHFNVHKKEGTFLPPPHHISNFWKGFSETNYEPEFF